MKINKKVVGILAAAVAIIGISGTGGAVAAGLIHGDQIAAHTITGTNLAGNSVNKGKLTANSVGISEANNDLLNYIKAEAGTSGSQGATGPAGPQGATGPQGPAGADGTNAPEPVIGHWSQSGVVAPGTFNTVTVECFDPDRTAIAGGFSIDGGVDRTKVQILESRNTIDGKGWLVSAQNNNTASANVRAWVICAKGIGVGEPQH